MRACRGCHLNAAASGGSRMCCKRLRAAFKGLMAVAAITLVHRPARELSCRVGVARNDVQCREASEPEATCRNAGTTPFQMEDSVSQRGGSVPRRWSQVVSVRERNTSLLSCVTLLTTPHTLSAAGAVLSSKSTGHGPERLRRRYRILFPKEPGHT